MNAKIDRAVTKFYSISNRVASDYYIKVYISLYCSKRSDIIQAIDTIVAYWNDEAQIYSQTLLQIILWSNPYSYLYIFWMISI